MALSASSATPSVQKCRTQASSVRHETRGEPHVGLSATMRTLSDHPLTLPAVHSPPTVLRVRRSAVTGLPIGSSVDTAMRLLIIWLLILVSRFLLRGHPEGRHLATRLRCQRAQVESIFRSPICSVHRWQAHLPDEGAITRVCMEKVESGVRLNQ